MGTLTIRLDDKLDRELNRLAKTQHKTKSEIARELLRRHILVRQLDEVRNKLRPYAEAAGYLTDEDFFRDIS
jgi:predicted transcriptional regulator